MTASAHQDAPEDQPRATEQPSPRPKAALWLTVRSDYLAAAKGRRHHTPLFTLQVRPRGPQSGAARFGITVTSKTGNAVKRNRIKRRLREAIRIGARPAALASTDYVVIGRATVLDAPFSDLVSALAAGVRAAGAPRGASRPPSARPSSAHSSNSTSSPS